MKSEIEALGRQIIEEHEVKEYDFLNNWMIVYIAEMITKYDHEKDEAEKMELGEKCTDIILKFWSARGGNTKWDPFSKYDKLLNALEKLIVKKDDIKFISFLERYESKEKSVEDIANQLCNVSNWIIQSQIEKDKPTIVGNDAKWLEKACIVGDSESKVIEFFDDIFDSQSEMEEEMLKDRINQLMEVKELVSNVLLSEVERLDKLKSQKD